MELNYASENEHKIINETIQLGGMSLKQSDKMLEDFANKVQNLDTAVVASILVHKIRSENLLFVSKAVRIL